MTNCPARELPLDRKFRTVGFSVFWIGASVLSLSASVARAQHVKHRTPALDLTLARHTVSGGFIDFRDGAMLDLLAAGELRSAPRWAWVAAGGASVILGGLGDRCLIRPDGGGCAPQGNFVAVSLLSGAQVALGPAGARALVGPALYNGAGDSSLGAQGRVDLLSPALAHVGLGVMARATVLPSHGGARLVAWAIGGSATIR